MDRSLYVLFALLSLVDLALTRLLLGRSRAQVYEANPIAKWFLERHGWPGIACFKSAVVLLVLGLSAVIFRYRPRTARGVLGFGCATLAIVVCYSLILYQRPIESTDDELQARRSLENLNNDTQQINRQRATMLALLADIRQDLLVERCTLGQAVDRLATLEQGKISDVLQAQVKVYPNRPVAQGIAAFLITHVVNTLKQDPHSASQLGRRLARQFESTYGSTVPTMLSRVIQDIDCQASQTYDRKKA
jgi:hypothetical protein